MPAGVTIPVTKPGTNPAQTVNTTSDYYTVEYRELSGWDSGFPAVNGHPGDVVLHLHAPDQYEGNYGYGYWVDQTPNGHSGVLVPGDEYVDTANNVYLAVNAEPGGTHAAQVTLSSTKINAQFGSWGATTGEFNDPVTLATTLTVGGSAPVPNAPVHLAVGSQGCDATTDGAGRASCTITIDQHPGSYSLAASFAGDTAYSPSGGSTPFTIQREDTRVDYTGSLTADYHDATTVSARLVDPSDNVPIAAKTIDFRLGASVSDVCSAVTDASGSASCSITPTQAAGNYTIAVSFAGEVDYLPSSDTTHAFVVTKEETATAYTGPTVILQGASGVTLEGQLLEDNDPLVPIVGRTLRLGLGTQSCTGTTNAAGVASCTLTFTGPLGPEPLTATFAGDAYYLSSDAPGQSAIVFAFPANGAFTLGDRTVAGATPVTPVTWWANDWRDVNSLTGGPGPASFKGFAAGAPLPTSTPPAACGGAWVSRPGNSPPPTPTVPGYMGVLVTSHVDKSGSTISGDTAHIVVVKVDPGYAPNPGSHGTGTVVATYC